MRSEARSSEESSRDPPIIPDIPGELVYVPLEDVSWEQYENSSFVLVSDLLWGLMIENFS
ncbi:MAG: hypothetical protein HQ517_02395 [SAR324 cluster bacterium]|nr:hypothetical protein [SAR324 cluster bacterium]